MGKKTPPCPEHPDWTTARFWTFVRSNMRMMWRKWPPKWEKLKEGKRPCEGKGRQKYEYHCEICGNWFPQKEIEIDHVDPAGSLQSWDDVVPFLSRLLVGKDKLRRACKSCHSTITKRQRKQK